MLNAMQENIQRLHTHTHTHTHTHMFYQWKEGSLLFKPTLFLQTSCKGGKCLGGGLIE